MKVGQILVATIAVALAASAGGQTLTILWSFTSGSDGGQPDAPLIQGTDGNFYGTTLIGGNTTINRGNGFGAVFRVDSSGVLTNLYSFTGYPTDGAYPTCPLVQGNDGNFYGVTQEGGDGVSGNGLGYGTVFRISPTGVETNLHSFHYSVDGGYPYAGLVLGSDGNFYGTTSSGGTGNFGTVFRITPSGVLTTIHSFTNTPGESAFPSYLGLVQGSDGNFYGTTLGGGPATRSNTGSPSRTVRSGKSIAPTTSSVGLGSFNSTR